MSFNWRTDEIAQMGRLWRVSDSSTVLRQEDSLDRALADRGGVRIKCPEPTVGDDSVQRIAAWRFSEQDVRIIRSRWTGSDVDHPSWMVQVSGFPVGYSGCEAGVQRRHLLTPMEMLAALHRWLINQAD